MEKLIAVFRIPELRQKIFLTLILLAVYRMGFWVMLPMVDQSAFASQMEKLKTGSESGGLGQVMQIVSLFSASNLGNATIFGLGIMPYISASIIFQLLGTVYPPLEKLQKEGESGRRKINEYTRYATVLICMAQSLFWMIQLGSGNALGGGGTDGQAGVIYAEYNNWFYYIAGALIMTSGTVFLMWLGEQIDEYGVGNGISLIIMSGILSQMPGAGMELLAPSFANGLRPGSSGGIDRLIALMLIFLGIVVVVIAITQAQRRIPIQSSKHMRGMQMVGGNRQFLPMRLNQSGVMPIIFASSLLLIPYFLFTYLNVLFRDSSIFGELDQAFGGGRGYLYNLCYVALIYFFCYFWTTIIFNPKDMANNLKDGGHFIQGYRPGSRTEKYLEQVMMRITFVGAGFLSIIAIIPTIIAQTLEINAMIASFYGGTGLLIVVSVALDLVQKVDSYLIMRNQKSLLDSEY